MTQLNHDNLCKFIGLCSDGPQTYAIFRYCSRRSLRDLIADEKYPMDAFFLRSISLDIVHGLMCLAQIDYCKGHGRLTSRTIVVDDRWVVKLTDYGLHKMHSQEKLNRRDLLWRAPEMIRDPDMIPNEAADVYSFGIVCSEVLTKKGPFGLEDDNEIDDTIYRLKRGGTDAPKPDLTTVSVPDLPPSVIVVIKECCMDKPKTRPSLNILQNVLRSEKNANESLMDHIFTIVESYADTLANEVAQRSEELTEEKQKSDLLLYRMLPKQVAESLKRGIPVQPENYDSVTVFFSDVVQFTQVSNQCSPLQVVNLLNDLYTLFDTVIEAHDVYKVETIGDGYLCVSGLPHRNGTDHVRQIAQMSLILMHSIRKFRIPHLPKERIEIRIGVHSGAVTAAVVGLSMPRYCLFGDTVNTASRMESNGKPSKIQITSATNLLLEQIGGFVTELRGDVIIKGKGIMETFWLVKKIDDEYESADLLVVQNENKPPGSRLSTATTFFLA